MKRIHNSDIWVISEEEPTIITRGAFSVTDEKLYNQLLSELQDTKNFQSMGMFSLNETSSTDIRTNFSGIGVCQKEKNDHRSIYRLYYNPRDVALSMLIGQQYDKDIDLLKLFHLGSTTKEKLEQLQMAKKILTQFEQSQLDSQSLKALIKNTWPNFGYFATECLDCCEISPIESYHLDEIKEIKRLSEKANIKVTEPVEYILRREDTATTNGKVLTLAKHARTLSQQKND